MKRATLQSCPRQRSPSKFQSTPSWRGRPVKERLCGIIKKISIHALVKRATTSTVSKTEAWNISIHALVKRATSAHTQRVHIRAISIHALVKRATFAIFYSKDIPDISIHALVKRATDYTMSTYVYNQDFNPRPREEGDPLYGCDTAIDEISIHALVKRATKQIVCRFAHLLFQSTPSWRGRLISCIYKF